MKPLLILRADATRATGAGHAMRCLNLAESWLQLGGGAKCWGDISIGFVQGRASSLGVPIVPHQTNVGAVLVVDLYSQEERLSLSKSPLASRRVLIDDLGESIPDGYDVVWNPNAYGDSSLYRGFRGDVIAGPSCVPIRRGLPRWIGASGGAISLGAGAVTPILRSALPELPQALGSEGWSVGEYAPPGWRRANPTDPWSDVRKARWLITAGGSTLWEAAAVGIPVVVVVFAENQELVGAWAQRNGAPVLDVRGRTDPGGIVADLARMIPEARTLPPITPGADAVASTFFTWSREATSTLQ